MAVKIKPKGSFARGATKTLRPLVELNTTGLGRAKAFTACVVMRQGQKWAPGVTPMPRSKYLGCGTGRNPRKAIAKAFRDAAKAMDGRRGAFSGLTKKRRK